MNLRSGYIKHSSGGYFKESKLDSFLIQDDMFNDNDYFPMWHKKDGKEVGQFNKEVLSISKKYQKKLCGSGNSPDYDVNEYMENRNRVSGIYFISNTNKSHEELKNQPDRKFYIKTGQTSNIMERLKKYKTYSPELHLLFFIPIEDKNDRLWIEKNYLNILRSMHDDDDRSNKSDKRYYRGGNEWAKTTIKKMWWALGLKSNWENIADEIMSLFRR